MESKGVGDNGAINYGGDAWNFCCYSNKCLN